MTYSETAVKLSALVCPTLVWFSGLCSVVVINVLVKFDVLTTGDIVDTVDPEFIIRSEVVNVSVEVEVENDCEY